MKRLFLLAFAFLASCTYYTEKQSEALSQNVYATNDSLGKARVDLAYFYSNETTKFVKPPKHPVKISPVFAAEDVVKGSSQAGKTRVVLVPDQYKNDKVIVVGSAEYQSLLQDRELKKQLEQDNKLKEKQIESNTKELVHQKEMHDRLVKDLNHLQTTVAKRDLAILWRDIVIVGLLGLIGIYIYLRINRLFMF